MGWTTSLYASTTRVGITTDDILVLRNIGPGGLGHAQVGAIPVPRNLAEHGVRVSPGFPTVA